MLMKDKGIMDGTLLKMIASLLKKNKPAVKGFKVKTRTGHVTVTYAELVEFITKLAEEVDKGNYIQVRKCDTCGNFSHPGRKSQRGSCFPKEFTSFRKMGDYCSGWTPMTKEQEHIRRKVSESTEFHLE